MLTFVVDCCVYVWRNAHGLFVDIRVLVIAAVVAMVAHRRSHATPHVVRSRTRPRRLTLVVCCSHFAVLLPLRNTAF
jgi:hypothetical protein